METESVAEVFDNLNIETAGTEEEAAELLEEALGMEVEETGEGKGKEEVEGASRSLGALEFLTQDAEPSGTTLVDARNGFKQIGTVVEYVALLAGGGEVCVQFL